MKEYLAICFIMLTTLPVKAQQLIYADTIQKIEIRLSPDHALGASASDLINNIHYYSLQNPDKNDIIYFIDGYYPNGNFIGLSSIRPNAFNNSDHAIFIYKLDGTLVKNISTTKDIKLDQYNSLSHWDNNFVINGLRQHFSVDTLGNINEIKSYGVADDSIKIKESTWSYYNPRYVMERPNHDALNLNGESIIRYKGEEIPKYYTDLPNNFSQRNHKDSNAYAYFPLNTKLFQLNSSGISKVLDFIFPMKNNLIPQAYSTLKSDQEFQEFIRKQPQGIYGFRHVFEYNQYLIMQLYTLDLTHPWFAYDQITKDFISLSSIIPDASNDYLPIIGSKNMLFSDGEFLYSIIEQTEILDAEKKCKEEGHEIRKQWNKLKDSKNPIMVRLQID